MEVTWARTIRIWWAHAWRSYCLLLIPMVPLVIFAVLHPAIFQVTFQRLRPVFDLGTWAWGTLSGIVTLRIALRIAYSEFRIVLEPPTAKL